MRTGPLTWINGDEFAILGKSVPSGHGPFRWHLGPPGITAFEALVCGCGGHLGGGDRAGGRARAGIPHVVGGPAGGDAGELLPAPGQRLRPARLGGAAGGRGRGAGRVLPGLLGGVGRPALLLLRVLLPLVLVLPLPVLALALLILLPFLGALAVPGGGRVAVGARGGHGLGGGQHGPHGLLAGGGGRGQARGPHGAGEGGDAPAAEAQAGEERAGDHRGHGGLAAAGRRAHPGGHGDEGEGDAGGCPGGRPRADGGHVGRRGRRRRGLQRVTRAGAGGQGGDRRESGVSHQDWEGGPAEDPGWVSLIFYLPHRVAQSVLPNRTLVIRGWPPLLA